MASFVLVHGGLHGGWCWKHIVEKLEALGHTALAVDLPGHGEDKTSFAELAFEGYVAAVVAAAVAAAVAAVRTIYQREMCIYV